MPQGWDLGLETEIWASRLEFESSRLGFEGGAHRRRRKRRRNFPCVKAGPLPKKIDIADWRLMTEFLKGFQMVWYFYYLISWLHQPFKSSSYLKIHKQQGGLN